ncbi:inositol monophosphatase family protein [Ornithinimicrobium sediminis]|uniref:inositol monophosphatase family protein n=1 Tax=Ornithinimicrobium sediminis TaxID=2904603 RepID=UPI001E58D707|nr:inositol monophosphatase family protein [Ornithinimicrobium sediminis]MCE0486336.1 histidinol phosphatase [Ornithinimicrobium sediminis]
MPVATFADDLRLAHVLADAVERYTLEMFHSVDLHVSLKEDGSLVTQADRHTEELLRHQLGRTRTRDVVQGEELPTTGHGHRRWILDPIDGTTNYIRGVPVWATLIALVVDDEPVLGLVSAPALSRRWWAAVGSGAWTGRTLSSAREIQVSDTTVLEHASLSHAALDKWWDHPQHAGFLALAERCWRTRGYGDFWTHVLVAEGAVDIGVDPSLAVHDMAALAPIVSEAGGRFTDLDGIDGPFGLSAVSTNGILHEDTLQTLRMVGEG